MESAVCEVQHRRWSHRWHMSRWAYLPCLACRYPSHGPQKEINGFLLSQGTTERGTIFHIVIMNILVAIVSARLPDTHVSSKLPLLHTHLRAHAYARAGTYSHTHIQSVASLWTAGTIGSSLEGEVLVAKHSNVYDQYLDNHNT